MVNKAKQRHESLFPKGNLEMTEMTRNGKSRSFRSLTQQPQQNKRTT
jgi:hypothetical protein